MSTAKYRRKAFSLNVPAYLGHSRKLLHYMKRHTARLNRRISKGFKVRSW